MWAFGLAHLRACPRYPGRPPGRVLGPEPKKGLARARAASRSRVAAISYDSDAIALATIDGVGRAPWFPSRPCSAGPIALKLLTFEYSVAAREGPAGAPLAEQPPP